MPNPTFAPAGNFAQQFGVKCLVYGPPGKGKTPIAATAPSPIICLSEPGALTLRGSDVPATAAFTPREIDDFYTWLFNSAETRNFQTVAIDSISQQAEIILAEELDRNKDGRKAYGEMSRKMMGYINGLYFSQNLHVYITAKQGTTEESGLTTRTPYFPGKDLGIKVPHLFDEILHLDLQNIPNVGQMNAFRCHASYDVRARDRSCKLAEFEPPNLTDLFNKILQG